MGCSLFPGRLEKYRAYNDRRGDRMANSESPGTYGEGRDAPEGEGHADYERTESIQNIVYCAFPNVDKALIGTDLSGLFMYDRDITMGQAGIDNSTLNSIEPKKSPFPDVISLDVESFLEGLQLAPDDIPQDSERAQYLRFYVLARSSCLLVHLDMGIPCPEMMIANLVGIPVIGVSERHSMSPMVRGCVDVIVNPVRANILAVVRSMSK